MCSTNRRVSVLSRHLQPSRRAIPTLVPFEAYGVTDLAGDLMETTKFIYDGVKSPNTEIETTISSCLSHLKDGLGGIVVVVVESRVIITPVLHLVGQCALDDSPWLHHG